MASCSLGGAYAALEHTVEHLKVRKAFKKPLADFQVCVCNVCGWRVCVHVCVCGHLFIHARLCIIHIIWMTQILCM